jgi:hypothetical protein
MKLTHDRTNLVTWTYSEVETALCLWEEVCGIMSAGYAKQKAGEDPGDSYRKLEQMWNGGGSFTMRAAVASMVDECSLAWEALTALNPDYADGNSFDFDFCPKFIADALDNGIFKQALEWQYQPGEKIKERDWQYPLSAAA